MRSAPVVLLAFNRPDKVERMLDRLRLVAPPVLYIGADGPRTGFDGDETRCQEVRALLDDGVDWPCDVRRHDWPANRGCEANTELTLDRVFSEVPSAIVLDDDCVPDPSFFRFCTELLGRYADDERVVHIAGTNDGADRALFGEASYAFTAFGSNWGWATWARAWRRHRAAFARPHGAETVRVPYGGTPPRYMPLAPSRSFAPATDSLLRPAARRFFADVAAAEDLSLSEWGQQWRLSMLNLGGLAITPAVNLIENIGFDASSTSQMPTRDMQSAATIDFPLRHPAVIAVNDDVEDVLERTLVRAVGRLARTTRHYTPNRLKELARRAGRLIVR